jgi:3-hydroxyacyl-[acyl-carrier-protein] dehydratase
LDLGADSAEQGKKGTTTLTKLEIDDILKALPHRYPFLMIDRIIDINGVDEAVGIKNVTFNEPMFQGHFPGKPIFPGVLIIEGMAQTAGAVVIASQTAAGNKRPIVLMLTIDKAKFRRPVVPGDRLEYHIKLIHMRRTVGRFHARAIVNGVVVADAEIGAMIAEGDIF